MCKLLSSFSLFSSLFEVEKSLNEDFLLKLEFILIVLVEFPFLKTKIPDYHGYFYIDVRIESKESRRNGNKKKRGILVFKFGICGPLK